MYHMGIKNNPLQNLKLTVVRGACFIYFGADDRALRLFLRMYEMLCFF